MQNNDTWDYSLAIRARLHGKCPNPILPNGRCTPGCPGVGVQLLQVPIHGRLVDVLLFIGPFGVGVCQLPSSLWMFEMFVRNAASAPAFVPRPFLCAEACPAHSPAILQPEMYHTCPLHDMVRRFGDGGEEALDMLASLVICPRDTAKLGQAAVAPSGRGACIVRNNPLPRGLRADRVCQTNAEKIGGDAGHFFANPSYPQAFEPKLLNIILHCGGRGH